MSSEEFKDINIVCFKVAGIMLTVFAIAAAVIYFGFYA